MLNKRAQGRSFWIIITMIIALVVVVLVVMWFSKGGAKGFGFFEEKIKELKSDSDSDGVSDAMDKCPCDSSIGEKFPEGVTECRVKCI